MEYSVSLEGGEPQPYQLKVMSDLLTQAHIAGLDLEEFVAFFSVQIQNMMASPPNFNYFGEKAKVWIMRGFYPGSAVFFKLVLISNSQIDDGAYYAKASGLKVNSYAGKKSWEANQIFASKDLSDHITNKMENTFFGANHQISPLVKPVKMPRCMSPKGLQLFRYKKPSKRGKNAKD